LANTDNIVKKPCKLKWLALFTAIPDHIMLHPSPAIRSSSE
jgi:hypothetical protein